MTQHPLPGFDTRPLCPACKRPAAVLGQWAPGSNVYTCRACIAAYSPPPVFVHSDNSAGVGLDASPDASKSRELYHARINTLTELARGCAYTLADIDADDYLPCMRTDLYNVQGTSGLGWIRQIDTTTGFRQDCKRCRNRLKYLYDQWQAARTNKHRLAAANTYTMEMPICRRCGRVHDHRYKNITRLDYAAYCERCDDEMAVEAFWRNRGIFGQDDDETILDRIQQSHPELFERGIMPDYWFQLKIDDEVTHGSS